MTYKKLKEKWHSISSLIELEKILGIENLTEDNEDYWKEINHKESLDEQWTEMNKLAVKMYFCKNKENDTSETSDYERFNKEIIAILMDDVLARKYISPQDSTQHDPLIELFNVTWSVEAFLSAINGIWKYNLENAKAGSFEKFFFSMLRYCTRENRRANDVLSRHNTISIYEPINSDNDDEQVLMDIISDEEKTNPIPFVEEPLILIQGRCVDEELEDYVISMKARKSETVHFNLFYTNDSIGIIKYKISWNEHMEKYIAHGKELMKLFEDLYIDYIYENPCSSIEELHYNEFKSKIKFDKSKQYENSENGESEEGIFIQHNEMARFLSNPDSLPYLRKRGKSETYTFGSARTNVSDQYKIYRRFITELFYDKYISQKI